jgi:formylmethanofuran dehydrogenase subunit E
MGLCAGTIFGLQVPRTDKRIFAIAETDGCLLSGIGAASGCWIERRTLRVEDYGKVAVTFVDTQTCKAVRVFPNPRARELAAEFARAATSRWEAMLLGYQRMPDDLLLTVEHVELTLDLSAILSSGSSRVHCAQCGEEIINARQVPRAGQWLCRACDGGAYYTASA